MIFDSAKFLRVNLPTPDFVVTLLQDYGFHAPSRDAVRKWFERESVPPEWVHILMYAIELQSGAPLKLAHYFKRLHQGD
jgi:hypothetical protein